jgi:phosphomevalonate kinase
MDVTTSAPGKLFLFGEYGVLAGGWSVVAAVDRRVTARRCLEATAYETLGAELDDATALPLAVLADVNGDGSKPDTSLGQLGTDIRELFAQSFSGTSGEKLGLGSSAASTVALVAACLIEPNTPETMSVTKKRQQVFERAFAAHRRLQGGRGSCADIAASTFGGIIGYRLRQPCQPFSACNDPDPADILLSENRLALTPAHVYSCQPSPVRVEPIWLGQPAVSTSFVSRCEDALRRERDAVQAALCRTSEIAASAMAALRRSDASLLLDLVDQADQALEHLGELIRAPIVTNTHRTLRNHAQDAGLTVKPSGAGGGDFSLAFGPADAAWARFFAELPAAVRHMPMRLGADGVRHESG